MFCYVIVNYMYLTPLVMVSKLMNAKHIMIFDQPLHTHTVRILEAVCMPLYVHPCDWFSLRRITSFTNALLDLLLTSSPST